MVATGAESVSVSWDPPPQDSQNGVIIAYTLTCQPDVPSLPATFPAARNYSISSFTPSTTYNCSVTATTSAGSGPLAFQTVTLLDDGKFIAYNYS